MDKLGIKATLYDILGYLVPGAILCSGIWFVLLPSNKQNFASISILSTTWPSGLLLLCFFYLIGHILSSLSSLVFENKASKILTTMLYPIDDQSYNKRTNELFGTSYKLTKDRILVSYCQQSFPVIYDTAFVFLAIYGFSRNCAMALLIVLGYCLTISSITAGSYYILTVACFLLIHNYLRFKKYYDMQIASALLMVP